MTKRKETKTFQPCFYVGREMYVPHVVFYKCWATYGGEYKTLEELLALGAVMKYEKLAPQMDGRDWISKFKL